VENTEPPGLLTGQWRVLQGDDTWCDHRPPTDVDLVLDGVVGQVELLELFPGEDAELDGGELSDLRPPIRQRRSGVAPRGDR
jgi:hypothetical protein